MNYQCSECLEYKQNGELYPALVKSLNATGKVWALLCLPCLREFQEDDRIVTTLDTESLTPREVASPT